MEQMDKNKAYEIIGNALGGIQTTRQNHIILTTALNTLYNPANVQAMPKKPEVVPEAK